MVPVVQQASVRFWNSNIAGQPVRLYADADTPVTVAVTRSGGAGTAADVSVSVSGYYVEVH
jgi:hypothetical protein